MRPTILLHSLRNTHSRNTPTLPIASMNSQDTSDSLTQGGMQREGTSDTEKGTVGNVKENGKMNGTPEALPEKSIFQEIKETEEETEKGETQENDALRVLEGDVKAAVAMDKGEEAVLESWTTEYLGDKGDNYLSAVKRVKARVTIGGREEHVSYVAKVKMLFSDSLKEFSNMAFYKESQFYENLLPELNGVLKEAGLDHLRVPKFYHYEKNDDREVIILEDLSARGFRMGDRKKGLDVAHVELVLQELARIHASSVLLQKKTPHEDLKVRHKFIALDWTNYCETAREDIAVFMTGDFLTAAGIAQNSKGYENVAKWLRELEPRSVDIFEEQLKTRMPFDVFLAGDCWTNNFLFRYDAEGDPVDVMLLDFQLCRKGSPALDLQTLMYSSVSSLLRRNYLNHFLQIYEASFSATVTAGGASPPFTQEELREEYNARNMYGVLVAAMYIPLMVTDSSDAPDFTQVHDEDREKFFADRVETVVNMMDRNPLLGERMCCVYDEWIDNGLVS